MGGCGVVLLLRVPLYSSLLRQPASVLPSTDCGQISFRPPPRFPVLDSPPSPSAPLGCPPHIFAHSHVSFTHVTVLLMSTASFWYASFPFSTSRHRHVPAPAIRLEVTHSWWAARLFRTGERMDVPFFCFLSFVAGYAEWDWTMMNKKLNSMELWGLNNRLRLPIIWILIEFGMLGMIVCVQVFGSFNYFVFFWLWVFFFSFFFFVFACNVVV